MISFQNTGLIDPRCITTIGVSVKEGDNPIGFFGTGLKYAIAIILRHGGEITIWRGTEPLRFDSHPVEIRGKAVSVIRMNGAELGFTTDLGKHWELWQAFREIYCNTQDERGQTKAGVLEPGDGVTTVQVELAEFADCFRDIHKYILQAPVICDGPVIAFHEGASTGVFYRSILVRNAPGPMMFTPNIVEAVRLTEDRTLKDSFEVVLAKAVLGCSDESFLDRWLTAPRDFYEHEADLDWSHLRPSQAFMNVTRRLLADTSRPLNRTAITVFRRHEETPPVQAAVLMGAEIAALKSAIGFCRALNYTVDEFPIIVVESLGEDILGKADRTSREIFIARRAIQMGDLTLASTLIEEWAHIKHRLNDESRSMQNWLLDSLVSMGRAYLFEREGNANRVPA